MRGLPEDVVRSSSPVADEVEALLAEGRFGRPDLALGRLQSLIPDLERGHDSRVLLLALFGRALLLPRIGVPVEEVLDACDVLERAAHTRRDTTWAAVAAALRAKARIDAGDVGAATSDLAKADLELGSADPASGATFRLLDLLSRVYARLRLYDRLDEARTRIDAGVLARPPLDQAVHWGHWAGELAIQAMEPLAGGTGDPDHALLGRAVEIAMLLEELPASSVPRLVRRRADAVRAVAAAYQGRPSEALRLLGEDAFGEARDLPPVERQLATLAAMRAHAHVGSLAAARSLDETIPSNPTSLVHLILDVCRARERLWLETHAGGNLVPVLHRLSELLVRLGWQGMNLAADTARQALDSHALREESRTDQLTGIGNRRAVDEELRKLLRFSPLPLALVLVDVDEFTLVNQRFGHPLGDEVLRQVTDALSGQLRAGDRLLRYGGDEFVVLLPATGDQEARRVAARMSQAVASRSWSELAPGLEVRVTAGCSALWALTGRRPEGDAERLFEEAELSLAEAKRDRARPALPAAEPARRPVAEPARRPAAAEPARRPATAEPARRPAAAEPTRRPAAADPRRRRAPEPRATEPERSRSHDPHRIHTPELRSTHQPEPRVPTGYADGPPGAGGSSRDDHRRYGAATPAWMTAPALPPALPAAPAPAPAPRPVARPAATEPPGHREQHAAPQQASRPRSAGPQQRPSPARVEPHRTTILPAVPPGSRSSQPSGAPARQARPAAETEQGQGPRRQRRPQPEPRQERPAAPPPAEEAAVTRIPLSPFPLTPEAMADHDRATGRWTDHRADSLADPVRDPLPQPTASPRRPPAEPRRASAGARTNGHRPADLPPQPEPSRRSRRDARRDPQDDLVPGEEDRQARTSRESRERSSRSDVVDLTWHEPNRRTPFG
ncbi:MAG: GGDEF domain-containing protein [Actinomycetales bacterium]|nr:GGDEF domain-containing protein [Actinomycetales bacterium]